MAICDYALSATQVPVAAAFRAANDPPIAICRDITINLSLSGTYELAAEELDSGSVDANEDALNSCHEWAVMSDHR